MQDYAGEALRARKLLIVVDFVEVAGRARVHHELAGRRLFHEGRYLSPRPDVLEVGVRAHAAGILIVVLRCVAATSPFWFTYSVR